MESSSRSGAKSKPLVCWQCGAALETPPLPLSRYELCRVCGAELHVCRMCLHYEPRLTQRCREERAEEVRDAERANFCDYLVLRPDAYQPPDAAANAAAMDQLKALFGEEPATARSATAAPDPRKELDALFGDDPEKP